MATLLHVGSEFINRELSWLEFNARVLSLAEEESVPLLERLKFVSIYSRNLDEFFQVRVGALQDQVEARLTTRSFDGLSPQEQLMHIRTRVLELNLRRDEILSFLLRRLSESGVVVQATDESEREQQEFLDQYFRERILPVLTPLAVDPAHPFPYISGLSLNIGVFVEDPATGEERFARLKVPTTIDRFICVGDYTFVPVEKVIADRLSQLFPGMTIMRSGVFRVTRNTDLMIHSEEAEDLLAAVELELRRRRFGNAVRIEAERDLDPRILRMLLEELELDESDVYFHEFLIDAATCEQLCAIDLPSLHDRPWDSVTAGRLVAASVEERSIFDVIKHRDLMVHHPYESFSTSTEEFIRQASVDPNVRAIKATLYRTSANSEIARSLISAAERGIQVVALIELTARFDEEINMEWARRLEEAGAHVVYGVVGLKIHAKCLLVVREESDGYRRYAHIGTGNYNSTTAKLYEDIGYFTCDDSITEDVSDLFNFLTGFSRSPQYRRLVTAPSDFRSWMLRLIKNEERFGSEGEISLKLNSLADADVIEALIAAAKKGVRVDLLVRGICCLNLESAPAEGVRVRSVLGRYLEHSRIYRFGHGATNDEPAYFVGSADLMKRNLDLRVEVLVPIAHRKHQTWIDTFLAAMWREDVVRYELQRDTSWLRIGPEDFVFEHDAQGQVMKWATALQQMQDSHSSFDVRDESSSHLTPRSRVSIVDRLRQQYDRFVKPSSDSQHSS